MTQPNPSTALARSVIDELVRNGVRRFVLSPGSRSTALAMAAASDERTHLTVALDERSAGFHALGMGKATGDPAAVIVTSGTAVANLYPAVAEASTSFTPMVLLTADRPPELRDVGANQTIDQVAVFGGYVRWFSDVAVAEDHPGANALWRSTVCRAVAEARGLRTGSGPVQLNLPFREPLVPASDDGRTIASPFSSSIEGREGGAPWTEVTHPSQPAEHELGDAWTSVDRGLVVAGSGGGPVHEYADRLAARLGWPLVVEPSAGGRPPQSITTAHFLAGDPTFAPGHRPDAVLVIGRIGLSRVLGRFLGGVPRIVIDPWAWSDPERDARRLIRGWPVVPTIDRGPNEWRRAWLDAERAVRTKLDAALDALTEPSEPRTARDVVRAVPAGGTLFAGSSMPIRDLDMFMPARDIRVIGNRGSSGIDGFASTALGVRAATGAPMVALGGDLSLLHDQNGFLLDPRPDGVFVVANNDGGGIFSFLPQAGYPDHFERVFGTPHGRNLEHLAAFHGMDHVSIRQADELEEEVASRLAGGLHLVEVRTDRAENLALHRELTERVRLG